MGVLTTVNGSSVAPTRDAPFDPAQESLFCPIKHARKILGTHSRYTRFLNYGEGVDYYAKLEGFRSALGSELEQAREAGQEKQAPVDSSGA